MSLILEEIIILALLAILLNNFQFQVALEIQRKTLRKASTYLASQFQDSILNKSVRNWLIVKRATASCYLNPAYKTYGKEPIMKRMIYVQSSRNGKDFKYNLHNQYNPKSEHWKSHAQN